MIRPYKPTEEMDPTLGRGRFPTGKMDPTLGRSRFPTEEMNPTLGRSRFPTGKMSPTLGEGHFETLEMSPIYRSSKNPKTEAITRSRSEAFWMASKGKPKMQVRYFPE